MVLIWVNQQLEELDHIFHSKNPVKESTKKKKLDIDANANIVHIESTDNVSNPA